MAAADYRLCDLCESKAFYDAKLGYERDHDVPRVAGKDVPQFVGLDNLGDWAVLCRDCAKTHRTLIAPITAEILQSEAMSKNPYGTGRGLLSRLINGVQFINGNPDIDGANKAMAEACAEIVTLIGKVDTLRRSLDALGLLIADAGYKWTPAMRQAYEQASHIKGALEDE